MNPAQDQQAELVLGQKCFLSVTMDTDLNPLLCN